jgi:nucleotide-binding universal stress UspA family protein
MTAIDFEYRLPSRTTGRGLYIVTTYRRILIAVDLTENSVKVAQCGRMLAAAFGSELEIIDVAEPLPQARRSVRCPGGAGSMTPNI